MAAKLYEVSDWIFNLRRIFDTHGKAGITFRPEEVEVISAFLMKVGQEATLQAHEISRHRWNALAREERQAEEAMRAELARPGTNVLPLPRFFERPADTQPHGAA